MTTTTTTTTSNQPADRLRAALKQAALNARRVFVRHDHSTLRVRIRDASVSLTKVQAIAGTFESVRRCEATGEILLGRFADEENDEDDAKYMTDLERAERAAQGRAFRALLDRIATPKHRLS